MPESNDPRASRKRWVFRLLTLLIVWVLCELIFAVGRPSVREPINHLDPVTFMQPYRAKIERLIEGTTEFMMFSRELGWTHKPWGSHGLDNANGQGIRAEHDYSLQRSSDRFRVASFGGSFVYGADVACRETWQALMEEFHPAVEVLNFGVSAYGNDQALLRYRGEGIAFHPDVVVLGFINENRLRNFSTFRPFYHPATGLPLGKPRFLLKAGNLVLIPNPFQSLDDYRALLDHPERELPRIGKYDSYYSQYEPSKISFIDQLPSISALHFWMRKFSKSVERWKEKRESDFAWARRVRRRSLLFRIFDSFAEDARKQGSRPLFMLCPIQFEYRAGDGIHERPYPEVKRYLKARGEDFLDLEEVFEPYLAGGGQVADLFAFGDRGGHYSAVAHRLIEKAMWKKITILMESRPVSMAGVSPYDSPGFVTRAARCCAQWSFRPERRAGVLESPLSTPRRENTADSSASPSAVEGW